MIEEPEITSFAVPHFNKIKFLLEVTILYKTFPKELQKIMKQKGKLRTKFILK